MSKSTIEQARASAPGDPEASGGAAAGVSRRALLGRALGAAAAGAAGAALLGARPVAATDGDPLLAGAATACESPTQITYDGGSALGAMLFLANDSAYAPEEANFPAACGGWAGAGATAGAGGLANGMYGYTDNAAGYGVVGANGNSQGSGGAGVLGITYGAGAAGVVARDDGGDSTALKVQGKATFTRSGRANVAAGKSYVDVVPADGLGTSANILATLQTHRSGVWVAACRKNYPSTGKVRIYLNKVASATNTTAVAWFVFG